MAWPCQRQLAAYDALLLPVLLTLQGADIHHRVASTVLLDFSKTCVECGATSLSNKPDNLLTVSMQALGAAQFNMHVRRQSSPRGMRTV
jgi:hypothetical protein